MDDAIHFSILPKIPIKKKDVISNVQNFFHLHPRQPNLFLHELPPTKIVMFHTPHYNYITHYQKSQ